MAELVFNTDGHSLSSTSLRSFTLPFVNAPKIHAALDASKGDPTRNSTEGNADSGTPHSPFSDKKTFHRKSLNVQDDCAFQDSTASSEDANPQLGAGCSYFAHLEAVPAFPNVQPGSDCAGFPYPEAASEGVHLHLRNAYEGLAYPQQTLYESPSLASVPSAVHISREEQLDLTEPYHLHEDSTRSHASSREVCAGCPHRVTKFQDPHMHSDTASMYSCEESTSSHEEGGDSTEPQRSFDDFIFSHEGYEDPCNDREGFTYTQELRVDVINAHNDAADPLKEPVDPYFQQLDAHAPNILQPCSSECSSGISMVTNVTSEVTSRLDNTYKSIDGIKSHWTDAKHGSYLDYMETEFVNNLFRRQYCALDVCGQGPFPEGSKRSSTSPSTMFEFKSWQSGDWHWRSLLKPPLLTCIPLSLRESPWVNHFRHHKSSQARYGIKVENVCISCGIDGEEEVNSPSTELCRGALGHLHASRSKTGREEKFLCKNGSSGTEAVGMPRQDVLQEYTDDTESPQSLNMKKRGLEMNIEQELCRQERSLRHKCEGR